MKSGDGRQNGLFVYETVSRLMLDGMLNFVLAPMLDRYRDAAVV